MIRRCSRWDLENRLRGVGAGNTEVCPNPTPGRPFSDLSLADRTSGRPWTIPKTDILWVYLPLGDIPNSGQDSGRPCDRPQYTALCTSTFSANPPPPPAPSTRTPPPGHPHSSLAFLAHSSAQRGHCCRRRRAGSKIEEHKRPPWRRSRAMSAFKSLMSLGRIPLMTPQWSQTK